VCLSVAVLTLVDISVNSSHSAFTVKSFANNLALVNRSVFKLDFTKTNDGLSLFVPVALVLDLLISILKTLIVIVPVVVILSSFDHKSIEFLLVKECLA
jgi:hypothetical protein